MQYRQYLKKRKKEPKTWQLAARERFYKRNFIIFEIGYILVAIPVLVVALISIPVLMYYAIKQHFYLWTIVATLVLIVFFQIYGFQFFIRKYYLSPNNMTLGEYLRMHYEIRLRKRKNKNKKPEKQTTWYDNLDEFILCIKTKQREQTMRLYALQYKNLDLSME
ncbi:MAG: hypothetical protein DRP02_04125 [Candidatus Gerdarchaeota archaeon]|nr:MAG: hypothetical protein DRO63_08095 [Candidatus Gerdarchaeota archaeon]RLI71676.1 MAG: hypothetical protein DRP02_04125 [Candidatus Gerdarchaeota archaeon]